MSVKRLEHLRDMLLRWRHTYWAGRRTPRFYRWLDEYNSIKAAEPSSWIEYCAHNAYSRDHDAYDLLA